MTKESAENSHSGDEEYVLLDGFLTPEARPVDRGPGKRVERTRATLAYLLFALLAFELVFLLCLVAKKVISIQGFGELGGVIISPVVGLLGAATGYYYGRGDK